MREIIANHVNRSIRSAPERVGPQPLKGETAGTSRWQLPTVIAEPAAAGQPSVVWSLAAHGATQ